MKDRVPEVLFKDDHYQGRPADYDDLIITRRVKLVKEVPNFLNKKLDLLDIGCGNGASMFELHDSFNECHGIDIEPIHVKPFRIEAARRGISNCTFKILNLEEESLDRTYQRIISFEVIEHFRKEQSVQKIYDVLEPGGMAVISVPNKWWIFETHGASGLPSFIPWNRVPFFSWLPTPIHEKWANARIYTKGRIVNLLQHVGFKVLKTHYVTAPLDVLADGWLKTILQKHIFRGDKTTVPYLSTSIMAVIKK